MSIPLISINPDILSVDELDAMEDHFTTFARYCRLLAYARREQAASHSVMKSQLTRQLHVLFEALPEKWRW